MVRQDPDTHSPTLRRYYQLLWSKPLPSGAPFELDATTPGVYLHPRSELVDPSSQFGRLGLSSDAVIPSFSRAPDKQLKAIFDQIAEADTGEFNRLGYTIGAMMVWPGYKVDGRMTINGARGFNRGIRDRFDLTLECIRRHYRDEHSPLGETLARYPDFFALFGDFAGYVEFFHLQDLVNETTETVRFSMPLEDFPAPRWSRKPSTRTASTATAPSSSLSRGTGGLPLGSARAADALACVGRDPEDRDP